jgi:predicted RND superfamily exporter protein
MTLHRALTDERIVAMSKGWVRVLAADAVLIILAALFYFFPKALPVPNLDIIAMVIALVAVALTLVASGVNCLNEIADQSAG